jgi:hypothetical protein
MVFRVRLRHPCTRDVGIEGILCKVVLSDEIDIWQQKGKKQLLFLKCTLIAVIYVDRERTQ